MFWKREKKNIGEIGEELAVKYLKKKGFKIIELNYQNSTGKRLGEIDIIAKKNGQIIFVEVKTRITEGKKIILPEENITQDKLRKLQKIAQNYIRENNLWEINYHFDAISILISSVDEKVLEIRHLESIFY